MGLSPQDDYLDASFFDSLQAPRHGGGAVPEAWRALAAWPDAVLALDGHGRVVWANAEAEAWLGSAWRDGAMLQALLEPHWHEAIAAALADARRGVTHALDGWFEHPMLGRRCLWLRLMPWADGATALDERPAALLLVASDITARQRTLEGLEAERAEWLARSRHQAARIDDSEARFRLMAEGLRDAAVFLLDGEGRIAEWPPSAERLMGVSASAALGLPVESLMDGLHAPADSTAPGGGAGSPSAETAAERIELERAALLGQCESWGWLRRADGTRWWAHTTLTALHDESAGTLGGYACLVRDMTAHKRLEDLLRQLNQELEQRVQQRTQALQELNRDLESFSASVSHDLRAPLRHILHHADRLARALQPDAPTAADTAAARERAASIAQSAGHMGALIEGLLAFSRLGLAPLSARPVPMGSLLQASLNRVRHDPALQRPGDALLWQLPADWPAVHGDGLLLSQVWDNLLANAIKYSRQAQPARIELGWRAAGADGHVFWVRDNGVGFDPARATRLFGVFERLHPATEFEGTGMGLALCRRIVERHGGRIWADAAPGQGSCFYFSLPPSAPVPLAGA